MTDFIGSNEQLCSALSHIETRASTGHTDIIVVAAAQARIAELEAALADGGSVIKQFNYMMTGHSDYHLQQWIPAQEALAPLLRDGVSVEDAINAMCKAALGVQAKAKVTLTDFPPEVEKSCEGYDSNIQEKGRFKAILARRAALGGRA